MDNRISLPNIHIGAAGKQLAQRQLATRFAPSPNGNLHLGHALSAICAHDLARAHNGRFLLRIEDIDGSRSRIEHRQAILADLQWLGLRWDGDVIYQSSRVASYQKALDHLCEMGLVYQCQCTRRDIEAAIREKPVPHGPDGPIYPGTCKGKTLDGDKPKSWRLDMAAALKAVPESLRWIDLAAGPQIADPALFGDIILWRKDAPASYHLAATLDDETDGISHIVRGMDLFAYTALHVLLQNLLGLSHPIYWHHGLLTDKLGAKLAKSDNSPALKQRREAGEDGRALADMIRAGKLPLGISAQSI